MFSFFIMLSFLFLFISSDDFIVDCICSLDCFLTVCEVLRFCVVVSWVLRIWESVFYSQSFFTLNSFLLLSRLPWDRQFCFEGCRASHWGSTHRPGPSVCLNHTVFGKRYYLVGSTYALGTATDYYIDYLSLVLNSLY